MAVYLNHTEIGIYKAPASYWATMSKVGAIYEINPTVVKAADGSLIHFEKVEVDIGKVKETFFVQRPKSYEDVTETLGSQFCYPPAANGIKCLYLRGGVSVSGMPLMLWVLLPPVRPDNTANFLRIHLPDLYGYLLIVPFGGGQLSWGLYTNDGSTLASADKPVQVNTAQWGSVYFTLYLHYFTIYSMGSRWVVLYLQINDDLTTKVLMPRYVSGYPQGDAVIEGYGALRCVRPTYDTQPFIPLNLTYPSGMANPSGLWIEDKAGQLNYVSELTFPARSGDKYPVVLRRCFLFHEPTKTVSGNFVDATQRIKSVEWKLDGGQIVGDELTQFGVGDAVKIVYGSSEWLFRVKTVRIERSGDSLMRKFTVELENPLLQSYAVIPIKLNPYLLRVRDIVRAIHCCVHLDVTINYSNFIDPDSVCLINEEMDFNSLNDWCDLILKLAGKEEGGRYFVLGKNVFFQTPAEAIAFAMPPSSVVLSYSVETDTSMPTVGIIGNTIIVSSEAGVRGISFRSGGYPISCRVNMRLAGLHFIQPVPYITFVGGEHNGKKAETGEVSWSVEAPAKAETSVNFDILGI